MLMVIFVKKNIESKHVYEYIYIVDNHKNNVRRYIFAMHGLINFQRL